jgi:pSer/pThr/pTyr-binding forkhead associated (FHA) protein
VGRIVIVEVLDSRDAVRHRVRLDQWPATIGRAYSADVLLDDPFVSPEHIRVLDGDGSGLVVEDLGSLNGLYTADGRRVSRATLGPGAIVRVGHTRLRFCSAGQAVPPALADGTSSDTPEALAGTGAGSEQRRGLRLAATAGLSVVCVAASLTIGLQAYLNGYHRSDIATAVEAGVGAFLILMLWASPWALAGRVITHRARLLSHLVVVSAATICLVLVGDLASWMTYLFPGAGFVDAMSDVATIVVFVGLLSGHLALASVMSASRRRRVVGTVTVASVALLLLLSHAEAGKFTTKMDYPTALRPVPITWVPTTSVAAFITATRDLKGQVDSLASER